jgi:transcriptional regulator with XRE-family HTH domain
MQSMSPTEATAQQRVAAEIRAHLARQGKDQRELATALQVSSATVSRWLAGRVPITITTAERIAEYLDVPITALFVGSVVTGGAP